mmetsp:Transcript_16548/g.42944  ORF Transcript_16548/g.42944 Transcript_16548/m.42944 type:complete len:242 (+) Transcript_16548:177-902(+)
MGKLDRSDEAVDFTSTYTRRPLGWVHSRSYGSPDSSHRLSHRTVHCPSPSAENGSNSLSVPSRPFSSSMLNASSSPSRPMAFALSAPGAVCAGTTPTSGGSCDVPRCAVSSSSTASGDTMRAGIPPPLPSDCSAAPSHPSTFSSAAAPRPPEAAALSRGRPTLTSFAGCRTPVLSSSALASAACPIAMSGAGAGAGAAAAAASSMRRPAAVASRARSTIGLGTAVATSACAIACCCCPVDT